MGFGSLLLQNKLQQDQARRNWQSVQGLIGARGQPASLGGHPGLQDVTIPGKAGSGLLENATSLGQENQLRLAMRMATNPSMSAGGNQLLSQYFGQGPAKEAATEAHTRALELKDITEGGLMERSQNTLRAAQLQRQADQAFNVHLAQYRQGLQAGVTWDNAQRTIQGDAAAQPWNDLSNQRRLEALGPRPQAMWPGQQANGPSVQAPAASAGAPPGGGTPETGAPAPGQPAPQQQALEYGGTPAGYKRVMIDGAQAMVPLPGQPAYVKAQEEVDVRGKLVDIIGEMQGKLDDTGPDYVGASAKEYDALYAQFQAAMAQLLELGVLQEGEAERLEERLPNPSSLGSNFMNLPGSIRAGYAQVMRGAAADLERAKRKYKGWGLATEQPGNRGDGWNYTNQ